MKNYDIIEHGQDFINIDIADVLCPECYSSDVRILDQDLHCIDSVGVFKDTYINRYRCQCEACNCKFYVKKEEREKKRDKAKRATKGFVGFMKSHKNLSLCLGGGILLGLSAAFISVWLMCVGFILLFAGIGGYIDAN